MKIRNGVLTDVSKNDIPENGEFIFPEGIRAIGENAFFNCTTLQKAHIPNGVIAIGYCAFLGCSALMDLYIPESVESIDGYAFDACSSLKKITIPKKVKYIHPDTFMDCTNLKELVFLNAETKINNLAIWKCENLKTILWGEKTYPVKCVDDSCIFVLYEKYRKNTKIIKGYPFPNEKNIMYIVEEYGYFGRGKKLKDALQQLHDKIMEDMYIWHMSCQKTLEYAVVYGKTPEEAFEKLCKKNPSVNQNISDWNIEKFTLDTYDGVLYFY